MTKHLPTGPGKITLSSVVPTGGVRSCLSNYDIDSDVMKPEHVAFLDSRVVPILVGKHARIWLQGSASRPGPEVYNMQLSQRRAEKVAAHLRSRGVQTTQMRVDAVGEGLAAALPTENSDDRSVSLLAAPLFQPPPAPSPEPTPVPDTPARSSRFRIRMLGGLSAGTCVIAGDGLFFQIWDPANSITSFYVYKGAGIGRGGMPLSVTLKGPWNDFSTTVPVSVSEFGGAARFSTAGAGPFTNNYLNMMSMPRNAATSPNPLAISTGFTIGIGASSGAGELELFFTGSFNGP